MAFVMVAILIAVMLPVLNGVIGSSPVYVSSPTDVGNLTGGGGVYGPVMNTTQNSLVNTIGSSVGLMVIVLLLIAVLAIIVVVGLFQYFTGGMGGRQ